MRSGWGYPCQPKHAQWRETAIDHMSRPERCETPDIHAGQRKSSGRRESRCSLEWGNCCRDDPKRESTEAAASKDFGLNCPWQEDVTVDRDAASIKVDEEVAGCENARRMDDVFGLDH